MAKQRFPWWAPTRCISRVVRAIVVLCFAAALHDALAAGPPDAALWVADHERIERINPATDQITLTVSVGHDVRALAVDPRDKAVWVLTEKRLVKFDSSGHSLLSIELATLTPPLDEPKLLALNPYDGSLWVGGEKTLRHLDDQGRNILDWRASGHLRAVALDADESLWILVNTQLLHVSAQGKMLAALDVGGLVKEPRRLAVDSLGGIAWIAGGAQLVRFDLTDPNQAPRQISLPPVKQKAQHEGDNGKDREEGDDDKNEKNSRKIAALGVHPVFGTVWVTTRDRLLLFDRSGALVNNLDLGAFALGRVEHLAWEPLSASLWLAGKRTVAHLTGAGEFVGRVTLDHEIDALGTEPFHLLPTLSILEPPDDSLTNNPNPLFLLELGADCNGFPCALADAYTRSLTLDAMLNGVPIGNLFGIANDQARYTPAQRLPEGATIFTAQAKDIFGHSSKKQTVHFIIDTIPPVFVSATPADGSFVNTPQVVVTGSVDDAGANVVLRQAGNTVGMAGAQFSFSVHLAEGSNILDLIATDRAGNSATLALHLTLDTVPPAIPDAGLITISRAVNGVVTVTGSAGSVEPNAQVVIRNTRTGQTVTVTANADGSFTATIAAQAGDDFVIIARDKAGNESAPTQKSVLADYGAATAYISGTVVDAASGVPLVGVQIRARGLSAGSYSDASGHFVLAVPGRAAWALFFERAGYISARRDAAARPGGDGSVGHVALRAFETKTTSISAANGGTLTDPTGNVQVVFPPGALMKDLQISATYLPSKDAFPLPLPENMVYLGGVQMTPEHVTFNKPVTMRLRNTLGLPAGTSVPFFFAAHDENDTNEGFYDPGSGVVTPDGKFVEYQVSHFSCMALGPRPPGNAGNGPDDGNRNNNDDNNDNKDCQAGSSIVQHCEGRLRLVHKLPRFNAFGRDEAPSLVYDSSTAVPAPYISAKINMPGFYSTSPAPQAVRLRVSIEGVTTEAYAKPSNQIEAFHFQWPAMNARNEALPTGSYPYVLEAANVYNQLPAGGTVPPYTDSMKILGRVILNNRTTSPFGAGWDLAELERIYRNPDGTLLLMHGEGSSAVFRPDLSSLASGAPSTSTLATGFGESRSVAVGPTGDIYVSSYSTGTIYRVSPSGVKTPVASGIAGLKGLAVASDGTIYAGSERGGSIYRIAPGGSPQVFATLSGVDHLDDLAIGPDGNVYALDGGFGQIHKVTPAGSDSLFYDNRSGYLNNAMSMVFDQRGNLYVSNNYNYFGQVRCGVSYISKFDRLGNHSYYLTGLNVPRGIATDDRGNLFVADYDCKENSYEIEMITPDGEKFTVAKNIAGDVYQFGLAYDLAFNNGNLYFVRPAGDVLVLTPNRTPDTRLTGLFFPPRSNFSEIRQDAQGNLAQTERNGTVKTFSPGGLLLETRTPQGFFLRYEYDTQGRVIARSDPAGNRWVFQYSGGHISQIVDPAGRVVSFTVDAGNNLVQVQEPEQDTMSYTYDGSHRVTSKTDSRGNTGVYSYGPLGNVIEARQANGEIRRFSSGRARYAVTVASAAASSLNNPLSLPMPDQVQDTYTDGRGNTSILVTNNHGSTISRTDPLGNVTLLGRNGRNEVTLVTYPNGATISSRYDNDGQLVQMQHSAGLFENYTYDSLFRLTDMSSNFRPTQRFVYDSHYNVVQSQSGEPSASVTTNYTYDSFGQPLTIDVDGKLTHYDYDAAGRVIRVTDPLGNATEFAYDAAGDRTVIRDALGRETRFEYDGLGRLIRRIDLAGAQTLFTYANGCATCGTPTSLLTRITDALGHTTRFEYDELGQITREIDPAGHVTTYAYDSNRNLTSITYPNGDQVALAYDADNRIVLKTLRGDTVKYTYDSVGDVTSTANNSSTLAFDYDLAGRATRITASGQNQTAASIQQIFDGFFRVQMDAAIGTTNPTTNSLGWSRDALFRPSSIADPSAAALGSYYTLGYDALGRRSHLTYYNGSSLDYAYDDVSRLLALSGTAFPGDVNYTYDAIGRRATDVDRLGAPPQLSLTLDRTTATDSQLAVAGQVSGGSASITVNGVTFTPDTTGHFQGTVPLNLGVNPLTVSVTDAYGFTDTDTSRSVTRNPPSTGLSLQRLVEVAGTGDAYVIENSGSAALIAANSGALTRPAWLTPARDVSVDTNNNVYTLRNNVLWVHDANGDRQVLDLISLGYASDMQVGPDNAVYVAVGGDIYRVTPQGTASHFASVPVSAPLAGFRPVQVAALGNEVIAALVRGSGTLALRSSRFGLVAEDVNGGKFYRVNPDGSVTSLTYVTTFSGSEYAVDPTGTVCIPGSAITCYHADGTHASISFNTRSVQFDATGVLYAGTGDNVYRITGTAQTPLATTATPVSGTLTMTVTVLGTKANATYTYDAQDQLTAANRTNAASETYHYDVVGNRLADTNAGDYRYNALNQLVSGAGVTYTYDANGNRITKTDGQGATRYAYDGENRLVEIDIPTGAKATYAYDPVGRRIEKRLTDPRGAVTIRRYVYDGEDILYELDGQNNVLARFTHGPGTDEPLAFTRNSHTYFYHQDALGSIVAITDETGALVQRYTYDAYGNVTSALDPNFKQPYGFTGREYDEESGLYYYRARYYDLRIGRFISSDPIGLAGGLNTYAYVGNDPLRWVDPTGLAAEVEPSPRPPEEVQRNSAREKLLNDLSDLLDWTQDANFHPPDRIEIICDEFLCKNPLGMCPEYTIVKGPIVVQEGSHTCSCIKEEVRKIPVDWHGQVRE